MSELEIPRKQKDELEKKSAKEVIASLTEKFENGETPHDINELRELALGVGNEWEQDGYELDSVNPVEYVDADGGLLMVARLQGDLPSDYFYEQSKVGQSTSTLRILMDGAVMDVIIPLSLQGLTLGQIVWREGKSGNTSGNEVDIQDSVYELDDDFDKTTLSPEMQLLVEKFGSQLTLHSSYIEDEHGCAGIALSGFGALCGQNLAIRNGSARSAIVIKSRPQPWPQSTLS